MPIFIIYYVFLSETKGTPIEEMSLVWKKHSFWGKHMPNAELTFGEADLETLKNGQAACSSVYIQAGIWSYSALALLYIERTFIFDLISKGVNFEINDWWRIVHKRNHFKLLSIFMCYDTWPAIAPLFPQNTSKQLERG